MVLNYFDDKKSLNEELVNLIKKAASAVILQELEDETAEGHMEISLNMVSREEIRRINSEYRGIDKETDVLSFPQYNDAEEIAEEISGIKDKSNLENQILLLGDVVICYEVAVSQSQEYGNSIEREIIYLFVHSMLHLFGYDHMEEDEKREMRIHEESVMEKLGLER